MPEDQGINGDIWNDEAALLLEALGWTSVGDSNVDIENEDGVKHGIDRMFKYKDLRRYRTTSQGVFVEAKRYKTTSFNHSYLQKWISELDKKIRKLKNSENLHNTYPEINDTILNVGIILIWFSDINNYQSFYDSFCRALLKIKVPASQTKESNKIFVFENNQILRLASLLDCIEKFESKSKSELTFYYPSSERFKNAANKSKVLTLDYIYSKFIFAEAIDPEGKEHKIVFYFGLLNFENFSSLSDALLQNDYIIDHKPLLIYLYERNDEFRKIKPDVIKLFKGTKVELKQMNTFSDLPDFMKQQ